MTGKQSFGKLKSANDNPAIRVARAKTAIRELTLIDASFKTTVGKLAPVSASFKTTVGRLAPVSATFKTTVGRLAPVGATFKTTVGRLAPVSATFKTAVKHIAAYNKPLRKMGFLDCFTVFAMTLFRSFSASLRMVNNRKLNSREMTIAYPLPPEGEKQEISALRKS